jgi:hypothetical protein
MFYLRRLAAFLAAFLVALVAARLCPIAVEDSAIALTRWWRSFWMGIAIASLALAIYGAKLLAGELAGRLLLPCRPRAIQMMCGLALVFAAVELPLGIGGAVWGAVALSGLGAFGSAVRRYFNSTRTL